MAVQWPSLTLPVERREWAIACSAAYLLSWRPETLDLKKAYIGTILSALIERCPGKSVSQVEAEALCCREVQARGHDCLMECDFLAAWGKVEELLALESIATATD